MMKERGGAVHKVYKRKRRFSKKSNFDLLNVRKLVCSLQNIEPCHSKQETMALNPWSFRALKTEIDGPKNRDPWGLNQRSLGLKSEIHGDQTRDPWASS